ncbi:CsgG/HfaB family protein [Derxia gummosa]|uniref:CsgG/HfaB family protein n=1 Tax=Derxia gummosa DSM 723 TaxID=1121388 RepID=A0A9U5G0B0_9BURK|nr:CsgG/HfaB family protein [Derxia gummosa]
MEIPARKWLALVAGRHAATMIAAINTVIQLAACAAPGTPAAPHGNAALTPATAITRDLVQLPPPRGRIVAAVYGFRDQTGQYKPSPDSSFSTSVTQGAASLLIKALTDSGWFVAVERENLQDLLTERKIIRALENPGDKSAPGVNLPQLMPANILIEGGVISYESNVRTGGNGALYLGISLSEQYRIDQVSVTLRSIDVRTGQILNSVSTTKTIYSQELKGGINRFVSFKELLQMESGYTRNEPAQLCVREAIEAAVVHLVVRGVRDGLWAFDRSEDMASPLVRRYLAEGYDGVAPSLGATSVDETDKGS